MDRLLDAIEPLQPLRAQVMAYGEELIAWASPSLDVENRVTKDWTLCHLVRSGVGDSVQAAQKKQRLGSVAAAAHTPACSPFVHMARAGGRALPPGQQQRPGDQEGAAAKTTARQSKAHVTSHCAAAANDLPSSADMPLPLCPNSPGRGAGCGCAVCGLCHCRHAHHEGHLRARRAQAGGRCLQLRGRAASARPAAGLHPIL